MHETTVKIDYLLTSIKDATNIQKKVVFICVL